MLTDSTVGLQCHRLLYKVFRGKYYVVAAVCRGIHRHITVITMPVNAMLTLHLSLNCSVCGKFGYLAQPEVLDKFPWR